MESKFTVLTPDDYVTTQWSGGSTTQLMIAPPGAVYADRDFLWRVSSATVELEESDFTPLPDYRRFISTIRGDMTLSHDGGDVFTLHPGDIHEFDGGAATRSVGRCTDFNLMLRKGEADGSMSSLDLVPGHTVFRVEDGAKTVLIYCADGIVDVSSGDSRRRLNAGKTLLVQGAVDELLDLACLEPAKLMIAQTWRVERMT